MIRGHRVPTGVATRATLAAALLVAHGGAVAQDASDRQPRLGGALDGGLLLRGRQVDTKASLHTGEIKLAGLDPTKDTRRRSLGIADAAHAPATVDPEELRERTLSIYSRERTAVSRAKTDGGTRSVAPDAAPATTAGPAGGSSLVLIGSMAGAAALVAGLIGWRRRKRQQQEPTRQADAP